MKQTLRESSYFVMAALLDGPNHGYAIMNAVSELSGGTVSIPVATIYGTLDRLALDKMIEQTGEEIVDGRARRIFALTDHGSDTLGGEAKRMANAATVVQDRLAATSAARTASRATSKKTTVKPKAVRA
jgi:PadR family transcriptional regulator, regulatory protein PadR